MGSRTDRYRREVLRSANSIVRQGLNCSGSNAKAKCLRGNRRLSHIDATLLEGISEGSVNKNQVSSMETKD